ncbi:MAG: hypothetical protein HY512_00695 [Candidatus Aenigmarchaeota archaeon]|nr:hypothetical protein [Candidatus Aenigmarchaeota archaeon]
MRYLSGFKRFARDAFLALSLAACSAPQPLPEAKIWGYYETPVSGKGMHLFTFLDNDKNGKYEVVEIRLTDGGEPVTKVVGPDTVDPFYTNLSRRALSAIEYSPKTETTSPEPARQGPDN